MGASPSTHHEPLDRATKDRLRRSARMDKLRRSFRDSFRRKKEHLPEASKPHQWQSDESAVRDSICSFHVKYLGCVEVFESRGMHVCEEALKVLRNSRRRPVRAILYVSGDGLRVVDDDTKGLIVDQTIEKVSFCAPDRNHDRGFSYICRDGTTRRWMCHGFLAIKDSGERLSHAVGCAFAVCLEKKQKRDKECSVTMNYDPTNSTFTRTGSFKQIPLTERIQDPQECKMAEPPPPTSKTAVVNPYAIERPHATQSMLQRQGSFRGFGSLSQASPFKRQLSLRLNDLPSTIERQRSLSLGDAHQTLSNGLSDSPKPPPRTPRNRLQQFSSAMVSPQNMTPIPEASPIAESKADALSELAQEVAQGLTLLSTNDDPFLGPQGSNSGPCSIDAIGECVPPVPARPTSAPSNALSKAKSPVTTEPLRQSNPWGNQNNGASPADKTKADFWFPPSQRNTPFSRSQSVGAHATPDPFDAEWASSAAKPTNPNNPFLQGGHVKAFEVHM